MFSGCYVTCDDEESVATSSEQGSPRPGAKTPLSGCRPSFLNNPRPSWHGLPPRRHSVSLFIPSRPAPPPARAARLNASGGTAALVGRCRTLLLDNARTAALCFCEQGAHCG